MDDPFHLSLTPMMQSINQSPDDSTVGTNGVSTTATRLMGGEGQKSSSYYVLLKVNNNKEREREREGFLLVVHNFVLLTQRGSRPVSSHHNILPALP
eukprot:scaffold20444_cov76-Amphora_coffeaeformis.AAC.1